MTPYVRTDIGLCYKTNFFRRDLVFRVSVENLLDKNYYSGFYYNILEPG